MPRRFQFRLQPILRLRESLEKEAQRHLARMQDIRREKEGHLDGLVQARTEAFLSRRAAPGEIVDLEAWKATERFLVALDRRIAAAEEALAQAVQRVLEAREALLRAHVQHLSLLRLRDRRLEQHRLETLHEEAKEVDDMTVLRFRHRQAARAAAQP